MIDNLDTFMCQLSTNVEASISWKTEGLSMPVMGLLELIVTQNNINKSGFHLCMAVLGLELRLHC
jgi:hypothetical protein